MGALSAAAANAAGEALLADQRALGAEQRFRRGSQVWRGDVWLAGAKGAGLVVCRQQTDRLGIDALDGAAAGLPSGKALAARAEARPYIRRAITGSVDPRAETARRFDAAGIAALRR